MLYGSRGDLVWLNISPQLRRRSPANTYFMNTEALQYNEQETLVAELKSTLPNILVSIEYSSK